MSFMDDVKPFRRLLELTAARLTDEEAMEVVTFFPHWGPEKAYATGARVQHKGFLYRCLTAHGALAGWEPAEAPSLWVRIDDPAQEWPPWRQPRDAQDAYPKGAKVTHNSGRWVSDADNNVWEPGVFGWKEAGEGGV